MNLRWADVDFANNQLYIAPNKTEYYRFVPMTESLRSAIERAKIGAESEFVVDFGRTRNVDSLTACYHKIAKAAGVDSFCTNYAILLPANSCKMAWNSIRYASYWATGPSK